MARWITDLPAPITLLPEPSDTALAALGRARWREAASATEDAGLRALALGLVDDPIGGATLDAIFGNSPYLTHCLLQDPAFACRLLDEGIEAVYPSVLPELANRLAGERQAQPLMAQLRVAKRRVALVAALADITGAWSLARITAALSDLAEVALRLASAHLLRKAVDEGLLEVPDRDDPVTGSGLIILAMGKLGARELNYSSDIDLIVLYDDGVARSPRPDLMARTFIRLARDLVRIMEERTRDGYVFRTDLRLRPDPGATPLAVSVSAAEAYYGSIGQNWERAAMIKARPVAGDARAGAAFLRLVQPFIWRRNLDFAAIQDIHSIKRQINAYRGFHQAAVNAHNVKLGHGGIREIEFFAQTQQLIFGGREPSLRVADTCGALGALAAADRVEAATAEDMTAAYRFLRRVEHRLQMIDDRQIHALPATDAGVAALATFLGYRDPTAFGEDLLGHLNRVSEHYTALFEEAPRLSGPGSLVFTGADNDPETIATLTRIGFGNPQGAAASVRAWHHGRYRATRSTRARELLTELAPALLGALAATPAPDAALRNFDAFLQRLPAGVPLFSLFHANPRLLALVAEIMGTAPQLAEMLSRTPARLDAVLTPGFFGPLPGQVELAADLDRQLATAHDFEDVLDLGRRWTDDQRFRAGVHVLRGITDGDACGPFLADTAMTVVAAFLARVTDEFARRHGRFAGPGLCVLAMGKLGGRQMSIGSDLDLITVYAAPPGQQVSDGAKPLTAPEYYIKLTQRLINAITAPTGEGRLYDVDLRLRPSGNKGPLATSLDAFVRYQQSDAWTWEHMALTRSRVVAGPPALAGTLADAIRAVLARPRDPDRLVRDVAAMRARIDKEFGTDNLWDAKYVRGGFIDIEFIAQHLMLRHAHEHPDVLRPNTAVALEAIAARGLIEQEVARELVAALRLWRRIQGFERLTVGGRFDPTTAPPELRTALARAALPDSAQPGDFAEAEAKVRDVAARCHGHFQRLIEAPAASVGPQAEPAAAS